jgi:diguanylate cyclase (GGDEF)-like protein
VGTGVGGQAIVEDRLCMTDDYASWAGAIGGFVVGGLRSAMATPVRLEGRPIGSLVVASHERGRTYSVPEQEILIAFAEHASLALIDAASVQAMNDALRAAVHDAMHDQLTDLPNRACFYERTEQALAGAGDGTCTAVLLFDLDRFKEINDSLGHRYGDRVLCAIGPRIRATLRDEDTLARLGGDEFCVLLPDVGGPAAAVEVARRVIALIEQPFDVDGLKLAVEASCGVAVAPVDGDSADLLLQRADVAMYAAKHAHAGVVAYDDSLNVMTPARLVMLGELRTAIADEELVLEYQPQAAMGSGRVEGVEALVRWRHPALGLVPPDQFIPLAERTGLIKALTTWVLDTALCQRRRWPDGTDPGVPDELTVAVNISSRSLLDESFLDEVVAALDRWDVPARLLTLEVTETTIMADPPRAYRLLRRLAATGVQLAIDDFGTGYSSLAHLRNLPVAELKIDKSFVLHMHRDPNDAIIVRSVIDLARNLGLRTVAEGVEDLDTWAQLAALGCSAAQGFVLARPIAAEALGSWMLDNAAPGGCFSSRAPAPADR